MDIKTIGLVSRIFKPLAEMRLQQRNISQNKDEVILSADIHDQQNHHSHVSKRIKSIIYETPDIRQGLVQEIKNKLHHSNYINSIDLNKFVHKIINFPFKVNPNK